MPWYSDMFTREELDAFRVKLFDEIDFCDCLSCWGTQSYSDSDFTWLSDIMHHTYWWEDQESNLEFTSMMMARIITEMYNKGMFCGLKCLDLSHDEVEFHSHWRRMYYEHLICAVQEEHESAIQIQALFRGHNARWKVPCFSWQEEDSF